MYFKKKYKKQINLKKFGTGTNINLNTLFLIKFLYLPTNIFSAKC